jgi:AcrR family transcriptional regulator
VAETEPVRRGRPPTISRAQILEAAERYSFGDLTMQALATSLNVTPGALYRYFPSKADLANALIEHVSSRICVPERDGRPWQQWVRDAASALRTYVRPERISAGLVHDDVAMYPLVEALAEVLADAGLPPRDSWDLYAHLCSICLGAASFDANFARYGTPTKQLLRAQLKERGVDARSALGRMLVSVAPFDVDEWFDDQVALAIEAYDPARVTAGS